MCNVPFIVCQCTSPCCPKPCVWGKHAAPDVARFVCEACWRRAGRQSCSWPSQKQLRGLISTIYNLSGHSLLGSLRVRIDKLRYTKVVLWKACVSASDHISNHVCVFAVCWPCGQCKSKPLDPDFYSVTKLHHGFLRSRPTLGWCGWVGCRRHWLLGAQPCACMFVWEFGKQWWMHGVVVDQVASSGVAFHQVHCGFSSSCSAEQSNLWASRVFDQRWGKAPAAADCPTEEGWWDEAMTWFDIRQVFRLWSGVLKMEIQTVPSGALATERGIWFSIYESWSHIRDSVLWGVLLRVNFVPCDCFCCAASD